MVQISHFSQIDRLSQKLDQYKFQCSNLHVSYCMHAVACTEGNEWMVGVILSECRMQFGCCANSPFVGVNGFAYACGINSEQCAPAIAT